MEYTSLNIDMTPELFDRSIKGSPKDAIKELIWNSCDADAKNINVEFEYDGIGEYRSISLVRVIDDGVGIPFDRISDLFGKYGCSDKTYSHRSPGGRVYHGKQGQGRYKAFLIGKNVKWIVTQKDDSDDKLYRFEIVIDSAQRMNVQYSPKVLIENIGAKEGTIVEITGLDTEDGKSIAYLDDLSRMTSELLLSFAPYLMGHKEINLNYHNVSIRPETAILEHVTYELIHNENGVDHKARLVAIKWEKVNIGRIYVCGLDGAVFDEIERSTWRKESVSMYLMSAYFEKMHIETTLDFGNADPVYSAFMDMANDYAKAFIKDNEQTAAEEELKKIKATEIYPFNSEPYDDIERAEQNVFDIIAVEVNRAIPELRSINSTTKKLTYRLMKEAVQTNPTSLKKILSEVFNLSKEQQDNLAKMLENTSLPAIIDVAKTVGDRLTFISLLEQMVYNDSVGKAIKERSQFHKILLSELWIFGEKYLLGTSDMSLKNVLKAHIEHLGRTDLIGEVEDHADDLKRIPDICLFQQTCSGYEYYDHLVIELKRPTLTLRKKEIDQIEDYAMTVSANPTFDKTRTKWHFILLGQDFDEYVIKKLKNTTVGIGNLYNADNVSVSVLQWNTIIQENKLKYEFLRKKLNHQVSFDSETAQEFLSASYPSLLKGIVKKDMDENSKQVANTIPRRSPHETTQSTRQ